MQTETSLVLLALVAVGAANECVRSGEGRMANLWGDALTSLDCNGPDGRPYPKAAVDALVRSMAPSRRGRAMFRTKDPLDVRKALLNQYSALQFGEDLSTLHHRTARAVATNTTTPTTAAPATTKKTTTKKSGITTAKTTTAAPPSADAATASCAGPPARLCKTRYNTTAPMFGVSLTSGKPVTIVQKFPDLLQQVIFEVCETKQCDVLHGECVQTYTPHLFLVIPLGPVTLTGQDYVLVESGCVCRPKYTVQDTALPLDSFSGR
ncbi:hypothetical protein FJT64_006051 [Amphibalanus amphitrite]|uniref:Uncharacterized protein n=1 Tax=Amphibalanus amphitrite TaxID=1232801 RepID=A0A6A4W086_AMPAM|nr:hypothetical protein FJT64_006051 [Amphibalanus amphitrite]